MDKGYILNYKFVEEGVNRTIKIALKYDQRQGIHVCVAADEYH